MIHELAVQLALSLHGTMEVQHLHRRSFLTVCSALVRKIAFSLESAGL